MYKGKHPLIQSRSTSSSRFAVGAMVKPSEEPHAGKTPIALDLSSCAETELIRWLGILGKSCVWAR